MMCFIEHNKSSRQIMDICGVLLRRVRFKRGVMAPSSGH